MALKLHVQKRDFIITKLELAAHAAGVKLDVVVVPEKQAAAALRGSTTGVFPFLQTRYGSISGSNAILRYIAGLREDLQLTGFTVFEQSAVDEWLEYAYTSVESIIATLIGSSSPQHAQYTSALLSAFAHVDAHLASRTYLVGERLSIADIAVFAAVNAVATNLLLTPADREPRFPHLLRWFMTLRYSSHAVALLGDGVAVAPAASDSATTPSVKKGGLPSALTAVDTKLPEEKFTRARRRVADVLLAGEALISQTITVCGWAKSTREAQAGKLLFIGLNDGSCFDSLQVLAEAGKTENYESAMKCGGMHSSFRVEGEVVKSPAKGQAIELHAKKITVLGPITEPDKYPLPKGKHSVEYLREILHLRPRSNLMGAVQRIRNACAYATHTFFQERGFSYVHTPVITGSDCEGAGEMFQVTTLLPDDASKDVPRTKDGKIATASDFFGKPTFLTVSGQLQVEAYAAALSDVYTFGPTFRAELSHTSRHLAEFWMIEPEISFATLEDDMALAEDYLKYCTQYVLDHCAQDLKFFQDIIEPGLLARLHNVVSEPFQRLTYTEAIELLTSPEHAAKGKFETKPYWGIDLASEHERYITEKVYKKPVILINYPKDIKAFYMKLNPDGKTVAAMDVLVPKVGEIIGGSQREDDYEKLRQRMREMNVAEDGLRWYLELRKYGSVPHAGFGLGFERLVMYVTGLENIRDAIPFPRWPGNALL